MIDQFDKVLASYSVTRTLYNADKGVYDILCKYVTAVLLETKSYSFGLTWITSKVNELGSFDIKEPVIKTCLKMMGVEHEGAVYSCNIEELSLDENWANAYEDAQKDNDFLMKAFLDFLSKEKEYDITSKTEDYYSRVLCDYLISGSLSSNDQLTKYIGEFILRYEKDERISTILLHLKEGTIIHEGIKYCDNVSEIHSTWKDELVLYLDTEILLGICNYNSNLLQSYCKDFMEYVKELNRKAGKEGCIRLRYFDDTYLELDVFFETGKRIIKGLEVADPTKEAIQQLIYGCKSSSDIEQKRTLFFENLNKLDIKRENRDFYANNVIENKEYNIECADLEERYSKEKGYPIKDVHRSLAVLSHINILRKGKNDYGFEKCQAIFVTATNRTRRLAFVADIYKETEVPLATSLDFVINRFWLRLHKGFGEGKKPRTLDMVSQARTLLAGLMKESVLKEYNQLRIKYENGELTKEEFIIANIDLKERLRKPEDIEVENFDDEIKEIEKWNLGELISNYEYEKEQFKEYKIKNQELLQKIDFQENAIKNEKEKNDKRIADLTLSFNEQIELRDRELEKSRKQLLEIEQHETERKNKELEQKKRRKRVIGITINFIIIILFTCAAIYFIVGTLMNWPHIEIISSVFAVFGVIGSVIKIIKKIRVSSGASEK